MYDVIIIGGSYAGLGAALQLGRARQRVLVLDAGQPRNRFARHSHGFLGQDGQTPEAIAAKGRAEVLAYPTVTWRDALATEARPIPGGFAVRVGSDEQRSKRLILAAGVVDQLPPVPGLAERWGQTVFFCPYCDGYELDMGRLGVLATGPLSTHLAVLVSQWAAEKQTTLFLNGTFEPDPDELAELAARDIKVERELVTSVAGEAPAIELRLRDGRSSPLDGLFVPASNHLDGAFAEQLGCEIELGRLGPFYKTDESKETTVPGVFACGDIARALPGVAYAVADGVRAGVAAHQSLVFRRER